MFHSPYYSHFVSGMDARRYCASNVSLSIFSLYIALHCIVLYCMQNKTILLSDATKIEYRLQLSLSLTPLVSRSRFWKDLNRAYEKLFLLWFYWKWFFSQIPVYLPFAHSPLVWKTKCVENQIENFVLMGNRERILIWMKSVLNMLFANCIQHSLFYFYACSLQQKEKGEKKQAKRTHPLWGATSTHTFATPYSWLVDW